MQDYEPLDLSTWCNAALDLLGDGNRARTGRQTLRGLPFLVGADDDRGGPCLIALEGRAGSVKVPIGRTAKRVIFAHRILDPAPEEGAMAGGLTAEYVFHLSGSGEVRVPIRERFEIASLPAHGAPFRAVSDQNAGLGPRYEGRWDQFRQRRTELSGSGARAYYLWVWDNPEPDKSIESLEIVPTGPRFIIAAVTLGHLDEHPFVRRGRREARIVLTDKADAEKPFDLVVQVDRGVATYVHPLPEGSTEEFIDDSMRGWGQAQNATSSPAYVEIAAVPSATVTVKQGQQELGKVKWGEVQEKGVAATPRMRVELLDRGRNWVHVTVVDDDTGSPVPCRVHFRSPEGIPYQPYGHHNHVNDDQGSWHPDVGGDVRLGQITYAYIDGTCQGWLPRGEVIVDVARGFEYEPLRARVKIEPGQQRLTLRLKRWIDMNARRWFSGDSHVHFLSTQGSHLESRGEDLNVVNLLQSQWGSLFTSTEEFTGRASVSQEGNNIVYVGQENRQHFLGHMNLWGLKRPVMPWCSDGPGEAELGGTMESTMSDWADQCHAQGGTVIIAHFPDPNGEAAALIATGRVDAVEMTRNMRFRQSEYYRYLNCGYRLPLVGGTDKMGSEIPVGLCRTYAFVPDDLEFSYDTWRRSVANGRTFVSGGPIIHLAVDGYEIGDTVQLSGAGTVEVEAWVEGIFPVHTLEIVQQGRVVAATGGRVPQRRLELKERLRIDAHTWLAARCGGPSYFDRTLHHDPLNHGVFAHTSPIYIACGGEWRVFDEAEARNMLTLVEGNLAYIGETAARHKPGTVTHPHGGDDHLAFLRRPFLEARDAIHRRIGKSNESR